MQMKSPTSELTTNQNLWGWGLGICFYKRSRCSSCMLKLRNCALEEGRTPEEDGTQQQESRNITGIADICLGNQSLSLELRSHKE